MHVRSENSPSVYVSIYIYMYIYIYTPLSNMIVSFGVLVFRPSARRPPLSAVRPPSFRLGRMVPCRMCQLRFNMCL